MKTINLTVENEYVAGAGLVAGAKGSNESTVLRVTFVGWDDLSKYATFRDAHGENPTVVVLALDMVVEENVYDVPIPGSAMTEEGLMSVTFTGYEVVNGNELGTVTNTARANLRVLPSDVLLADDYSVSATLAQQLQSEIDVIQNDYLHLTDRVAEAAAYASASQTSANNSASYSVTSKSYAMGDTGTREGEDTDNSKYYKEQTQAMTFGQTDSAQAYRNECRNIFQNMQGGFIPAGSIYFANLPSLDDIPVGYLYSIKDDFTTTSDFKEGAGVEHEAGTSVYKTGDGYWDVNVTDIATLQSEVEDLSDTVTSQGTSISNINTAITGINTSIGTIQGDVTSLSTGKVDKEQGKGLSAENYTTEEKTKLAGIAAGANATTVDSALSSSSDNPVKNSVISTALGNKSNKLLVRTVAATSGEMDNNFHTNTANVAYSGYTPIGIIGLKNEYESGTRYYDFTTVSFGLNGNTAYAKFYCEMLQTFFNTTFTVLYVKN